MSVFPINVVYKYKSFFFFYFDTSGFILAAGLRGRKKVSLSKIIDAITQTYVVDRVPLV